jgi:ABC-type Mn2+/Zn2+ transport system permease subunit
MTGEPVVASVGDWWLYPFLETGIMQNALLAGLLVVLATSIIGTWVVLRGMSFLGDALAHGILPGVVVAFLLGINTSVGAFVAGGLMVLLLSLIRRGSPLPEDTSIGVVFVGFLALAVVLISGQTGAYIGDLDRFLFGSIVSIDSNDLLRQAVAALVILVGVGLFHRSLLATTFDPLQARLAGLNPRLSHVALMALLAIAIVASFEAVGNLLVFAFLVAPPATAAMLVRRVPSIMVLAAALGATAVWIGLVAANYYGTAPAATIALVTVGVYLVVVVGRAIKLG